MQHLFKEVSNGQTSLLTDELLAAEAAPVGGGAVVGRIAVSVPQHRLMTDTERQGYN